MSTEDATRRPRTLSSLAVMVALAVAGVLHGPPHTAAADAAAPAPAQAHEGGHVTRVVEVTPRIGPPGTMVTLTVGRMPALTPVQVALGATRTGFEALALGLTTIDGDLQESVEVPDWAGGEQTHRFIVFNAYFSAILAESAVFHVTDADGGVVREGEVGSAGPACLTLEGDDGERYRLAGATANLQAGSRARLEGVLSEAPEGCGEGLSLNLEVRSPR